MSILKKMSKKREDEPKNHPVSTRLTDTEFQLFYKLCEETGYSISEAMRVLIQQELKPYDDEPYTPVLKTNTESKQENTTSIQNHTLSHTPSTPVVKRSATVNKRVRPNRFVTTDWMVEDKLPCPLCNGWVSASNFSRHAKQHDMTTQEIFEKHKDKADEMVKQRKDTP